MMKRRKGFTFVEVLLVISLMAIVLVAVFQAMAMGITLWDRITNAFQEEDTILFFEKLTRDLRNSFRYSSFDYFQGDESELGMATLVRTFIREKKNTEVSYIDGIGMVTYFWDPVKHIITRRERNYNQILKEKDGKEDALVSNVLSLRYKYFVKTQFGYEWKTKLKGIIPASVMVIVETITKGKRSVLTRVINIPQGMEP